MIINPPPAAGGSMHRLKRGTKASEIPTLAATGSSKDDLLNSIDGPFQLAEYLACRVRADPHDVKGLVEVPKNGQDADRDVWIYEHLRRLPVDLAPLVSQLLTICSRDTCPSMKADEWLYLCVAHGSGGTEECCAIDYILHTLDSTTTLLNSTKNFPSRMSIPAASLNNFPSLSRRLSRIFSHAYFHHREAFLTFEADSSLYARFMALCETYGLVGSSLLVIPREESGLGVDAEEDEEEDDEDEDDDEEENGEGDEEVGKGEEEEEEEEEVDSSWSEGNDRYNHPANESADTDSDSHSQFRSQSRRRRSLSPSATLEHKILLRPKAKTGTKAEAEAEAEATKDEAADHPRTAPSLVSTDNNTSDSASRENTMNTDKPDVPIPETAVKASTRGRGTLSRGKQARGTVLWSSDAPPVPVNESKSSSSSKGDDGEDKSGGEDK